MARRSEDYYEEEFEANLAEDSVDFDEIDRALDDDEISPEEAGFLRGAKDAENYWTGKKRVFLNP